MTLFIETSIIRYDFKSCNNTISVASKVAETFGQMLSSSKTSEEFY